MKKRQALEKGVAGLFFLCACVSMFFVLLLLRFGAFLFLGHIPMVMIAPADAALILGGSEERRRFMDMVIMQYSAPYLDALIRYDKALKQRNALLKQDEEPDENVMTDKFPVLVVISFNKGRKEFVLFRTPFTFSDNWLRLGVWNDAKRRK